MLVGSHYETLFMSPLSSRWFLDFGEIYEPPPLPIVKNNNRQMVSIYYTWLRLNIFDDA